MIKQYETVFIATPVLSEAQMKEAVAKYTKLITDPPSRPSTIVTSASSATSP